MNTIVYMLLFLLFIEKLMVLKVLCDRTCYQTKKEFWVDILIPFCFFGKSLIEKILASYRNLR